MIAPWTRRQVAGPVRSFLGAVLAMGLLFSPVTAAAERLDTTQEAMLLLRALAYDRFVGERVTDQARVLVVCDEGVSGSCEQAAAVADVLGAVGAKFQLGGHPLTVDIARVSATTTLDVPPSVAGLFVEELGDATLNGVLLAAATHRVPTVSGIESYAERGVAVTATDRGGRPTLTVNLPASATQGAEFNAQLLKLAELIR